MAFPAGAALHVLAAAWTLWGPATARGSSLLVAVDLTSIPAAIFKKIDGLGLERRLLVRLVQDGFAVVSKDGGPDVVVTVRHRNARLHLQARSGDDARQTATVALTGASLAETHLEIAQKLVELVRRLREASRWPGPATPRPGLEVGPAKPSAARQPAAAAPIAPSPSAGTGAPVAARRLAARAMDAAVARPIDGAPSGRTATAGPAARPVKAEGVANPSTPTLPTPPTPKVSTLRAGVDSATHGAADINTLAPIAVGATRSSDLDLTAQLGSGAIVRGGGVDGVVRVDVRLGVHRLWGLHLGAAFTPASTSGLAVREWQVQAGLGARWFLSDRLSLSFAGLLGVLVHQYTVEGAIARDVTGDRFDVLLTAPLIVGLALWRGLTLFARLAPGFTQQARQHVRDGLEIWNRSALRLEGEVGLGWHVR